MAETGVCRVDNEHIDTLVKRLEPLGPHSAKIRCLLLLLKNGINKFPCHIFVSGSSNDIVVVVITEAAPDFHSVSALARDEAGSLQRMGALLRAPELEETLWRCRFRADFVPAWLEPLLGAVAVERGFQWRTMVKMQQTARAPDQPEVRFEPRPGVSIEHLDSSHFDTVKRFWPYSGCAADADAIIGDGLSAGLSAGAFLTDGAESASTGPPAADRLVSWCVLNHNGSLAFMHTLESHRQLGLGKLVVAKLTQICERRGYPCSASTALEYGTRSLATMGYTPVGEVLVGMASPQLPPLQANTGYQ